jgi:hypothetical protein
VPAALVEPGSVGPMHLIPAERCVGPLPSLRMDFAFPGNRFPGRDPFVHWLTMTMAAVPRLQGHRTGGLCEAMTAGPVIGTGQKNKSLPAFPLIETSEECRSREAPNARSRRCGIRASAPISAKPAGLISFTVEGAVRFRCQAIPALATQHPKG